MLNSQILSEMSMVDIEKIDSSMLVSINSVFINHNLPHEEKVLSVIEQMGNPYCFLSDDTPVRIRFADGGKQLSDSLISYFSQLKQR